MGALGVTKSDQFSVQGHFFTKNCALDGIQFTTGCTLGNGNLSFEEAGKAVFSLSRRDGKREVTVSISEQALFKLGSFKQKKALLLEERDISGLPRAQEIDREIAGDFDSLIEWAQYAPDEELFTVTGGIR